MTKTFLAPTETVMCCKCTTNFLAKVDEIYLMAI